MAEAEAEAVAVAMAYEERRRTQIEANKRKLEELQLHRLSAAVREAAAAAKPSLAKKRKARDGAAAAGAEPLRRSGRLADLPEKPVYYHVRPVRITKPKDNARLPLDAAERSDAISKAEDLVQHLGSSFPIFIQPMIMSHVTKGFWLGLPTYFCLKHLPKRDESITLVDEVDDESEMLYRAKKADISTGWKEFAIKHKLHDGDCLVFQLIEPTKFKVYIIRATSEFESEH